MSSNNDVENQSSENVDFFGPMSPIIHTGLLYKIDGEDSDEIQDMCMANDVMWSSKNRSFNFSSEDEVEMSDEEVPHYFKTTYTGDLLPEDLKLAEEIVEFDSDVEEPNFISMNVKGHMSAPGDPGNDSEVENDSDVEDVENPTEESQSILTMIAERSDYSDNDDDANNVNLREENRQQQLLLESNPQCKGASTVDIYPSQEEMNYVMEQLNESINTQTQFRCCDVRLEAMRRFRH